MKSNLAGAIFISIIILFVYGCGGGGGGGSDSSSQEQTYTITGSIELPSNISATMTACVRQQQLYSNIIPIFIAPDGTKIYGEMAAGNKYIINKVPPCTNREIQVQTTSGKTLLIRFVSSISDDIDNVNINIRSTAISYYIRNLTLSQTYEDVDTKAQQGIFDISDVETSICSWISGNTSINVTDVASAVTQIVPADIITSGVKEIQNTSLIKPLATITTPLIDPTNCSPIIFNIIFNKEITGFEIGDIQVTNGTPIYLQQDSTNLKLWTLKVTPSAPGNVSITIPENSVNDSANNGNLAPPPFTITFDNNRPAATITTTAANPTNLTSIPISITFSKAITEFGLEDIKVTNGTPIDLIQDLDNLQHWKFKVIPTAAGKVSITLPEYSVKDSANNGNIAPSPMEITFDNNKPLAVISSAASNPTNTSPIQVLISFSEPITEFDLTDINVTNGTAILLQDSPDLKCWTLHIKPTSAGEVTVSIPENSVKDTANNTNISSNKFSIKYQPPNFPPMISIISPENNSSFNIGSPIDLIASASDRDGSISKVEFYLDPDPKIMPMGSSLIGEATNFPYTCHIPSDIYGYIGICTFTAIAIDNSGSTAEASPVCISFQAKTNISGIINSDQTWSLNNSPYRLSNTLQIAYGKTVTVEPGVVICGENQTLQVFGNFNLIGSPNQRIILNNVNLQQGSTNTTDCWNMNIQNCIFNSGALLTPQAINGYGTLTLQDSVLIDIPQILVRSGYPNDCFLERNIFVRCGEITAEAGKGSIFITNNVFIEPSSHLSVKCAIRSISGSPIIEYNSFLSTNTFAISLGVGYSSSAIASNNYWNTTNESTILNMIYDRNDNLGCSSIITYKPFLIEPHANTPDPSLYY